MPNYTVIVRATATVQTEIDIDAGCEKEAQRKAVDLAENDTDGYDWELANSMTSDFHGVRAHDVWADGGD